jgi:hypothetical protein
MATSVKVFNDADPDRQQGFSRKMQTIPCPKHARMQDILSTAGRSSQMVLQASKNMYQKEREKRRPFRPVFVARAAVVV